MIASLNPVDHQREAPKPLRFRDPGCRGSRSPSRTPSERPTSLVIPTHVALGPLGFSADLGTDPTGMHVQLVVI